MQRQHLLQFPRTQPQKEPPNREIQPHMKSKDISGKGHTGGILNKLKQSFNSVMTITPNAKSCRGDPAEPGHGFYIIIPMMMH